MFLNKDIEIMETKIVIYEELKLDILFFDVDKNIEL